MQKLTLETLETRDVPASILLQAGVLTITGTAGNDTIFVNSVNGQFQAVLNDQVQTFDPAQVQNVVLIGDAGNDRMGNNVARPGLLIGNDGNDSIFGGSVNDTLIGGAGQDVLYDLPGVNTFIANDGEFDRVFGNAQSTIVADTIDQQVIFFGAGRTPGAGSIQLQNGVLYVTPSNDAATKTVVQQVGAQIFVTSSFAGTQIFNISDVSIIAYFGGTGNDILINNSPVDLVGYGGLGGNDFLQGGFSYNLLKGGGGNDVLFAIGTNNELMGDAGADTLIGNGNTFFRRDANDTVINLAF